MKLINNKAYKELKSNSRMLKAMQSGNFKDLSIDELNLCRQTIKKTNDYHKLFNNHISTHLAKFFKAIKTSSLGGGNYMPTYKFPPPPPPPPSRTIKPTSPFAKRKKK